MSDAAVLVSHPWCNAHDTGPGHPESRARLPALLDALRRDAALAGGALREVEARPARLQDLLLVHTPEHVAGVERAGKRARETGSIVWLDPDTAVSEASFEAARASAGCAICAVEEVVRGEAAGAFAACRPPGHHAIAGEAMGFCLFDNVAVAARYAQRRLGIERVLIVDWDVHHGNGTQEIFWEDPSVYLLSLHLRPHYPGTGAASERGGSAGAGTTRNVPLPVGTSAAEYRRAFSAALGSALDEFSPELVLVSAGFDCLAGDPLGGLELDPEDLHAVAAELVERTRVTAGGRIAAVLEGGYVPERMGQAAVNVVRAFVGLPAAPAFEDRPPASPA
ncbi:MAG TPA: histone deacetylase [Anaeromyxobacteraceae bacterium]|nr:histone deacetylase [Anaeromyxobacteraceae bacterium]